MNRNVLTIVGLVMFLGVGFGLRSMVFNTTSDLGSQVASNIMDPKAIQGKSPEAILKQGGSADGQSPLVKMVFKQLGSYNQKDRVVLQSMGQREPVPMGHLDLENPTGQDLRFLFKTLKNGEEGPQASAARALVEIGDPAFVSSLLTSSEGASDPAYYCTAARDILNKQGQAASTATLVQVTTNPQQIIHDDCRAGLDMTLLERGGLEGEGYLPLLSHDDPRVLRFALSRVPTDGVPGAKEAVKPLLTHNDEFVKGRAEAWMEAAGPN